MPYYGRMRRSYGRRPRSNARRYSTRRTIGANGMYQARRAKAMSQAIVSTAKSNKYADALTEDYYAWVPEGGSLTSSSWPSYRWKRLEDDIAGGGYNLLDIGGPGSGIALREGRRVNVKKVDCRIRIELPGVAGLTNDLPLTNLEFVMVLDKQANGAAPSSPWYDDEIFNCHTNLDNLGRFEVLKRKRLYTNGKTVFTNNGALTTNTYARSNYMFTMRKTWKKPLRVNFNSTASSGTGLSFAATVDNSISIYAIHDMPGVTGSLLPNGQSFKVHLDWRTVFQDAA